MAIGLINSRPAEELKNVAADTSISETDSKRADRNKLIKQIAWGALAVLSGLGAVVSAFTAIAFLFNAVLMPASIPFFKLSGFLAATALGAGVFAYSCMQASGEMDPKKPEDRVAPGLARTMIQQS